MSNPSLFVPLLDERDTELFESYVLEVIAKNMHQSEDGEGTMVLHVPDPDHVILLVCQDLLVLPLDQCVLLLSEVPEADKSSEAYKTLIKPFYTPDIWCQTVRERVAASQIALVNAVIKKYNSKIQ